MSKKALSILLIMAFMGSSFVYADDTAKKDSQCTSRGCPAKKKTTPRKKKQAHQERTKSAEKRTTKG